jgi:hypothetical protein
MKIKISTGVAESTKVTMEEKCGGAVVNGARTNLGVNSLSMSVRRTMMKRRMKMTKRKTKQSN